MINFNPQESVRNYDTLVLSDSDCVAYWSAATCDNQALRTATRRCDIRMNQILDECQAEHQRGFLTGENNFRDSLATLQRYKGNRYDSAGRRILPQPKWLKECRQYLIDNWGAELVQGEEADDALSYTAAEFRREILENPKSKYKKVIISSIDKDLWINSGDHHNQNTGKLDHVTEDLVPMLVEINTSKTTGKKSTKVSGIGMMFFYAQLLMGDSADWIKGLPTVTNEMKKRWPSIRKGGCGAMAAVHVLDGCETHEDALERVWFCYESYWTQNSYTQWDNPKKIFKAGTDTAIKQFMEQGRLLWMRQKPQEKWSPICFPWKN